MKQQNRTQKLSFEKVDMKKVSYESQQFQIIIQKVIFSSNVISFMRTNELFERHHKKVKEPTWRTKKLAKMKKPFLLRYAISIQSEISFFFKTNIYWRIQPKGRAFIALFCNVSSFEFILICKTWLLDIRGHTVGEFQLFPCLLLCRSYSFRMKCVTSWDRITSWNRFQALDRFLIGIVDFASCSHWQNFMKIIPIFE